MSLINDALKKAQKQRTGEAAPLGGMPGVGGQPAARIAQRRQANSSGIPYLQIGIGVGVALFLIVGSVFLGKFLMNRPSEPEPAKPAVTVAKVAPKPETPAPALPASSTSAPASTPTTFVLPIATPPASTTPAAPVATTPAPVAAQPVVKTPPPVVPAPEPEPVKAPAVALKLETRAITFIESLRVAGIRASTTDSKVLMNDRVYRIGNIVEHEMGIKLTGITANSLTFEDERGASYTRNF